MYHSSVCFHFLIVFSDCVLFFSCKDTLVGFRAQLDLILILPKITSAETLFQIRSLSEVPDGHEFSGDTLQPTTSGDFFRKQQWKEHGPGS